MAQTPWLTEKHSQQRFGDNIATEMPIEYKKGYRPALPRCDPRRKTPPPAIYVRNKQDACPATGIISRS